MKSILLLAFASVWFFASSGAFADDLATEKQASQAYVEKMKQETGAFVIDGGVVMLAIHTSASTVKPDAHANVVALYEGVDREGNVFDSAFERREPATFPLDGVIKCWQTALPTMTVGSYYKFTCPSETAYGDRGAGGVIKPGAAITFYVALLEVK